MSRRRYPWQLDDNFEFVTPEPEVQSAEKQERAARLLAQATAHRHELEQATAAIERDLLRAHCMRCGRVLFLFAVPRTRIRLGCKRCGHVNDFAAEGAPAS